MSVIFFNDRILKHALESIIIYNAKIYETRWKKKKQENSQLIYPERERKTEINSS